MLISPLFTKKQVNNQRQDDADNQHRGDRNKHEPLLALNTYIAGQPAKPANQPGRVTNRKPDNRQNNANHHQ